jgi:hypothetical protein
VGGKNTETFQGRETWRTEKINISIEFASFREKNRLQHSYPEGKKIRQQHSYPEEVVGSGKQFPNFFPFWI